MKSKEKAEYKSIIKDYKLLIKDYKYQVKYWRDRCLSNEAKIRKTKLTGKELLETHHCSLTPTMNLKWVNGNFIIGKMSNGMEYAKAILVLKQKFTCNCGKSEWREIETED